MVVNLKYLLLFLLILMLAYVLYKRLIAALSKGKGRRNYLNVISAHKGDENISLHIKLEVLKGLNATIQFLDDDLAVIQSESQLLKEGVVEMDMPLRESKEPKWLRIVTDFETIERKITINH